MASRLAALLGDREAVSRGLTEMAVEALLAELPRLLEEVVGQRQALVLLERLLERAAGRGFRAFLEAAGARPEEVAPGPGALAEILEVLFSSPGGERLHPFQLGEAVERLDGGARIILKPGHGVYEAAALAGVVAGVLDALGVAARPLPAREGARHLCGQAVLVAYPEQLPGGRWATVITPPPC